MWPTVEELYVDVVPNHCDQVLTAVLMCFLGFDRRVDFVAHANPSFSTSASGHVIARGLGAMLVFFLCFMTLLMELISDGNKENTGEKNRMGFMAYGGGSVSGLCGGLVNLSFPAGGWTDWLFSVGLLRSVLLLDDHFHYGFM